LTGCTLAEAGSNTNKSLPVRFTADQPITDLLKKIDGQTPEIRKKTIVSFRLSLKNGSRLREKSAYVLARILNKGGSSAELKEAIPLFEEAAKYGPLFQRCQFHIADCANTLGDEPLVRSSLERILSGATMPLLRTQVEYLLAQSYLRAREDARANKGFQTVLKLGPDTQFAFGARYYLGQSAFQNKNLKEALKFWREYLAKSPDGRFSREIAAALESDSQLVLLPADHVLLADVHYAHGEWQKALSAWQNAGPADKWFEQSICLMRLKKTEEGKKLLLSSLQEHPGDADVVQAATLLARMGTRDDAIAVWRKVLANCPAWKDMALYNLAYRAQGDESLDLYSDLVSKFPKSDFAPESSWWLVWDKIKAGKNASALADLKNCADKYAGSRIAPRFYYWCGKLEEKEHQTAAAKKAYEQTTARFGSNYYGWRARARLNVLAGKHDSAFSTDAAGHLTLYRLLQAKGSWAWPLPPSLISYQQIVAGSDETIAALCELQQWDECLDLLPKDRLPQLKSLSLAKLNLVQDAINTMSHDLTGAPGADKKWQLAYPLLHMSTIASEAAEKEIDPFLAHALIRQESRYNIYALSSSNAIGLMQLLPATAMGVAKRLGVKIKSQDEIHKPGNNLKFGIDYLAHVMDRFDGKALLAVASYNGGPNAVAGWTRKFALEDPDSFVENIPLAETRDYVREVFSGYWNYLAIYAQKTPAAAAARKIPE
jgi:soluble lytic murein transglycosylase